MLTEDHCNRDTRHQRTLLKSSSFIQFSLSQLIFLTSALCFSTWLCSDISAYQNITHSILAEEFSENVTEYCVFVIFLILHLRPDCVTVVISSSFITILILRCSIAVCRSCSEGTG